MARPRNCPYCGLIGGYRTRDHIIPESRGGWDCHHNLIWCCFDCNNQKGHFDPRKKDERFMAYPLSKELKVAFIARTRAYLRDIRAVRTRSDFYANGLKWQEHLS